MAGPRRQDDVVNYFPVAKRRKKLFGSHSGRFGVSAINEADPASTITHNLRTAIVDRRGRLVKIHSGNEWTMDGVLADLRDAAGR